MSVFTQLKTAMSQLVYGPPRRESYAAPPAVYQKREYFTPQAPTKTYDSMWTSLPKMNPRVLLGGHGMGMLDNELISGTSNSWDPRGEHESVKKIQAVVLPGQLLNERQVVAAQQRAENRDLAGFRPMQI